MLDTFLSHLVSVCTIYFLVDIFFLLNFIFFLARVVV